MPPSYFRCSMSSRRTHAAEDKGGKPRISLLNLAYSAVFTVRPYEPDFHIGVISRSINLFAPGNFEFSFCLSCISILAPVIQRAWG